MIHINASPDEIAAVTYDAICLLRETISGLQESTQVDLNIEIDDGRRLPYMNGKPSEVFGAVTVSASTTIQWKGRETLKEWYSGKSLLEQLHDLSGNVKRLNEALRHCAGADLLVHLTIINQVKPARKNTADTSQRKYLAASISKRITEPPNEERERTKKQLATISLRELRAMNHPDTQDAEWDYRQRYGELPQAET